MPSIASSPVVRLLADLIALPSVNPSLVPSGDPRAGEQRPAEFLAATAARAGLDIELRDVFPGRPNLFVVLSPAGRVRRRVLLAPHLDTVGGDDPSLWQPQIRGGRLRGRGACDTKGSVAAMFQALLKVVASGARPRETEVVFVGLIDEEHAQAGSRVLARSGGRADLAVVGEPTRLDVVTAHKGGLWLRLETLGRAAHGARPELGRNAVHAMARVVDLLETRYRAQLKKRSHPLLGHGTVNVGRIQGGVQPNIVPDRCVIEVDRRSLPGETLAGARREVRALLRQHGLQARVESLREDPCPALETDPRLPLVQSLLTASGRRTPAGAHYFCDAAILAAGGIPAVVFGPGDIAQAHTAEEWIELRQVESAVAVLERFLRGLP